MNYVWKNILAQMMFGKILPQLGNFLLPCLFRARQGKASDAVLGFVQHQFSLEIDSFTREN